MKWIKYEEAECIVIAICNYSNADSHHMDMRVGDILTIKEFCPGWYRGFNFAQPCAKKIFPKNFVKTLPVNTHPEIWGELSSLIPSIRQSYLSMEPKEFEQVTEHVEGVCAEKSDDSIDNYNMKDLEKRTLLQKIDQTKKILSLPIEFKNEKGEKLSLDRVSPLELFSHHQKLSENDRNVQSQMDNTIDNVAVHIKMINVNFEHTNCTADENQDIVCTMYRLEENNRISRVSESYITKCNFKNGQSDLYKDPAMVMKDIQFVPNQKFFLVFHFVRLGSIKVKKEADAVYRRPKGVAVLDITNYISNSQEPPKDVGIQVIGKEDQLIETITESLIKDYRVNKDYRSQMTIQMKIIRPEDISDRDKIVLGINPNFPSPIKTHRNMLYLNLHHCEIDRGRKKSDHNLEVEVSLRDKTGKQIITRDEEGRQFKEHRSVVYYHFCKPVWAEAICVPLFETIEEFPSGTHFRFVFWHRSLNDRPKKPFGVAYLKLFPCEGAYSILPNRELDNYHKITVHKMEHDDIIKCQYLSMSEDIRSSRESIVSNNQVSKTRVTHLFKGSKEIKDYLYVQTLLCSNDYTTDMLLANLCCVKSVDLRVIQQLHSSVIVMRNIDSNEMKKFSKKIMAAGLNLLQQSTDNSHMGHNILSLLGEMFKVIKNLDEYQNQVKKFIAETMHFNVHRQIMQELIKYYDDTDTLKTADWFMKIVVKSFQNYQNEVHQDNEQNAIFIELVDEYLRLLESLSKKIMTIKLKGGIVLQQAGQIMNALIGVSKPRKMAPLVNSFLQNSEDFDSLMTSNLTMEIIRSPLFSDAECRDIIIPSTTKNIIDLFSSQIQRTLQSREVDHDHLLDNICDNMLGFMSAHERHWKLTSANKMERDKQVQQLVVDNGLLRSVIAILASSMEYVASKSTDSGIGTGRLIRKPIMVLVSVVLCCLSQMSETLWGTIIDSQIDCCNICEKKRITNSFDMIMELLRFIIEIQRTPVFPSQYGLRNSLERSVAPAAIANSGAPQVQTRAVPTRQWCQPQRGSRVNRAWHDMLYLQSRQLLITLSHLHTVLVRRFIVPNLSSQTLPEYVGGGADCCSCHPSLDAQSRLMLTLAECVCDVITQPYLCLETLPGCTALRLMHATNSGSPEDLRYNGAVIIWQIWNSIGEIRINYSTTFFPIFGKLTTTRNFKVRLLAVQGMLDIVSLDRDVKKLELITHIDQAMEQASDDESYCSEMSRAFKQAIAPVPSPENARLVDHIIRQMRNIEECSQHLSDLSPLNSMIVINNLQLFYKDMGRSDIISRYLWKLMEIHSKIDNHTEMGYTLVELSSFYKWSGQSIQDTFPTSEYKDCSEHWQLKSKLLENSLKYFDKEDWEQGIEVCRELIDGYSNFMIDFVKLSEFYKRISLLMSRVMDEDRQESHFYIVFYIGPGYPKFISELPQRSVVIRSHKQPRELHEELNNQFKMCKVESGFPTVERLANPDSGTESIIYYRNVKPNKFNYPTAYDKKHIKRRVLRYYETYKLDEFIIKTLKNPGEENPKKRKIEASVIKLSHKLPNILSLTPVESIKNMEIDVLQESLSDLSSLLDCDDMMMEDFEVIGNEKRCKYFTKIRDSILKYVSPVSGGIKKILDMIQEDDSRTVNEVYDLICRSFSMIFRLLQVFEICDTFEQYSVLLDEFNKILEVAADKLDAVFVEFNVNQLKEQYNRTKVAAQPIRRPSVFSKQIRTGEEVLSTQTINRRFQAPDFPGRGVTEESMENQRRSTVLDIMSSSTSNYQPGGISMGSSTMGGHHNRLGIPSFDHGSMSPSAITQGSRRQSRTDATMSVIPQSTDVPPPLPARVPSMIQNLSSSNSAVMMRDSVPTPPPKLNSFSVQNRDSLPPPKPLPNLPNQMHDIVPPPKPRMSRNSENANFPLQQSILTICLPSSSSIHVTTLYCRSA